MSCVLVFGDWKEGGSCADSYSVQASSRGKDPPGTELELAALESCEWAVSLGPAPRKDRTAEAQSLGVPRPLHLQG